MHEAPKKVDRRVIPRWRPVAITPTNELTSIDNGTSQPLPADFLDDVKQSWKESPSLNTAADLLFAGKIVGSKDPAFLEASEFLTAGKEANARLHNLASIKSTAATKAGLFEAPAHEIRRLKFWLSNYPNDSISHVEIARNYTLLGELSPAAEHLRVALALAPQTRFVLRSAARFDIHRGEKGDPEHAWRILEKRAKVDPWICAARVAIADLHGFPIEGRRALTDLLERQSDPADISELAAVVGTLELKSGRQRRGESFLQKSLIAPNENVIAQLEWASSQSSFQFDEALLSKTIAPEAQATHANRAGNWVEAVDYSMQWLSDEPFSARPAFFGGFIASEMLQDFKAARWFAENGLASNPHDAGLMNNLAFSLIHLNEIESADELLIRARRAILLPRQKIILTATEGLSEFRKGHIASGERLYSEAIQSALAAGDTETARIGMLHLVFEKIRSGQAPNKESISRFISYFSDEKRSSNVRAIFAGLSLSNWLQASQLRERHDHFNIDLDVLENQQR